MKIMRTGQSLAPAICTWWLFQAVVIHESPEI
jgi:hypothetical protein